MVGGCDKGGLTSGLAGEFVTASVGHPYLNRAKSSVSHSGSMLLNTLCDFHVSHVTCNGPHCHQDGGINHLEMS